ncbi:Ubiquitin-conjugating enzyme E2 D2 [Exophiala xenobiotica]
MTSCRPIYDNPWDLLCTFLGPDDTPYEGGIFFTRLAIPEEFPYKPPIVKFLTRVYHPNIDARGRVCADILGSMYSPALGLYRSLISVISILDDPNVDDPLVPEIAQQYRDNREEYNRIVFSLNSLPLTLIRLGGKE